MNGSESVVERSNVVEETREERAEGLERVLKQRERHLERSIFVRVGVVIAGGVVGLVACPLAVIAPEVGLPLLLVGLRLLALEFDWATRAYARVARLARRIGGRLRKLLPRSKRGVFVAVVLLIGVALL